MTKTELRKEWEARVEAFKDSGQSTSAWCAAHDLKPHQLRSWLRKLHSTDASTSMSSQWLSLEVGDPERSVWESAMLIKVGHATVEVKPGFDPTLLSDIVRTLAALC